MLQRKETGVCSAHDPSIARAEKDITRKISGYVDLYCLDISSAYPNLPSEQPACSLEAAFCLLRDPLEYLQQKGHVTNVR